MINLRKLRIISVLRRATSDFAQSRLTPSGNPLRPFELIRIAQNPRLYSSKADIQARPYEDLAAALNTSCGRTIREARKEAKDALMEYLHSTRCIQYLDADNMSRNSPCFIDELLKKIGNKGGLKQSISRYLRYHPINEFEPFFESIGLKPSEYVSLLPKNMIFLSDDQRLLENYYTLCNYGIPRHKLGKIFKEASEVFRLDHGVLSSKLQAYEKMGLVQSTSLKVIACSPYILVGDGNIDFIKVIEKLKHYGNDVNWIEGHLLDDVSYNWSQVLELLSFLGKVFSEQQLANILSQHPDLLFDDSGGRTLSLIGFLLKLGLSISQVSLVFLEFPQIQVGIFLSNLRRVFQFLSEVDMKSAEIRRIFCSHSVSLGSFTLKKTSSLLSMLNAGKKRIRIVILDNPLVMKNWALGKAVKPIPDTEEERTSRQKIEFLLSMGYVDENMEKALKSFRGNGAELQERFDYIVKAGLDYQDVRRMVRVSPQILNLTIDVLNTKMDLLVNELGYPISSLAKFPSFLSYKPERVRLRLSMYNWLVDQECAVPKLSLSTVVSCTNNQFVEQYVNRHPSGLQVWEELKNKFYSDN